jgi:hypothetical protein
MRSFIAVTVGAIILVGSAYGQVPSVVKQPMGGMPAKAVSPSQDSIGEDVQGGVELAVPLRNVWGLDFLISDDGFGMGAFYRRLFTEDLSGFVTFSISESKDDREVERFDPFTQVSFVPGKLSRFIVMPLMAGVQYRLFREDIVDNFRPFVTAGAGPTVVFAAPFVEFIQHQNFIEYRQLEFFNSLGKGRPYYTVGAFLGAGANFGSDRGSVFGVSARYYFTYLLSDALPSLYDTRTGRVIGTKKSFGGFFLTLNVGFAH